MAMQKRSILPKEYQQVEWVNGASCNIDLDYIPTIEPKVITQMAITAGGDRDVMGFPSNTSPSFIIDVYVRGSPLVTTWYNRYGGTSSYRFDYAFDYSSTVISNPLVLFEFGKDVKANGHTYATLSDVNWSINSQSFHMFGARTNHMGAKFATFQLWDGSNLVRNMIPCYRKADDVIGLYDTVSKAFFTSAVGVLTKGPNV